MNKYNKENLSVYPVVSKTISEPNGVEIKMENVVDVEPNYQKIPVTVSVVPHKDKVYVHFSGIGRSHIEIEHMSANSFYIVLKHEK